MNIDELIKLHNELDAEMEKLEEKMDKIKKELIPKLLPLSQIERHQYLGQLSDPMIRIDLGIAIVHHRDEEEE